MLHSPGEFVNQRIREEVRIDLSSMGSVLPFMGMVMVILVQFSNVFVIKNAISIGINKYVIVVYSDLICSLIFLLFIILFTGPCISISLHASVHNVLESYMCESLAKWLLIVVICFLMVGRLKFPTVTTSVLWKIFLLSLIRFVTRVCRTWIYVNNMA